MKSVGVVVFFFFFFRSLHDDARIACNFNDLWQRGEVKFEAEKKNMIFGVYIGIG